MSSVYLRENSLTAVFRPVASDGAQPVATVAPSVMNVQQGQRAEFRCTVTGNPTPAIEWIGRTTHNASIQVVPLLPTGFSLTTHLWLVQEVPGTQ